MTFHKGRDDSRRRLAESEVLKVLSRLQDDDGFAEAVHESDRVAAPVRPRPVARRSDGRPVSNGRIVLIDIRTCGLSVKDALERIDGFRSDPDYSGYDIIMDGDLYAVVAVPRSASARSDAPIVGMRRLP